MISFIFLLLPLLTFNRSTPYIPNEEVIGTMRMYNNTLDESKIKYYNTILFENNYGWIKNMADELSKNPETVENLIQSGSIGLIVSTSKYKPETNVKFITYTTFWIKAYMYSYIRSNRIIRLPNYMHKRLKHFKYSDDLNYNSLKDIASNTTINTDNLWAAMKFSGFLYNDLTSREKRKITIDDCDNVELVESLYQELHNLPIGEQELIYARYLASSKITSYKELSMLFGVGRETLRARTKKILNKLVHRLSNN